MTREELASLAGISVTWLRQIEAGMFWPGQEARERIRTALEECPIHRAFGIKCGHRLPVPEDERLYSKISDLKAQ